MGSYEEDTTSASGHIDRNSGESGLEYVRKEATHYRICSSDDDEQNDSPGEHPRLVSECDRTVVSLPEIDRQKAAARIYAQNPPPLNFPHYVPYAPCPQGAGSPVLHHYFKQALHQIPQAIPAYAHGAQPYPAHTHAQPYPAHTHARQNPTDTRNHQYPAHACAHQYPAHAHAQQYPAAPSLGDPSSSHQYPAAPAPTIDGRPMPQEIAAAYGILARAKQHSLPNPHAALSPPNWPLFAPPPGIEPAKSYYYPSHLAQPSYHMLDSVPAPLSYPQRYPTDLPYDRSGPIPPPESKNRPGISAPHEPAGALSSDNAGKTVSPFFLASQMEKETQKDESSTEKFSESLVGEGEPTSKKRPRKLRKQQNPVYATLSKKTMIEIMEKYGPIVWYSGAKRPYLDWDKERTLFALRQIFFRWNPNFTDDFYYIKQTDSWMPIRGEQNEIVRRAEIRRRCHVETKGLRTKMYEKRRNGPRSSWKKHTSRYVKVQDRCNSSNAEREGKKQDTQQLDKDGEQTSLD
jgi:hypothetical protein